MQSGELIVTGENSLHIPLSNGFPSEVKVDFKDEVDSAKSSVMQLVYENGEVLVNDTLDNIRARAKGELV